MYLAIKWLVLLALAMWITLSGIDMVFQASKKKFQYKDLDAGASLQVPSAAYNKNITYTRQQPCRLRRRLQKLKRYQPSDHTMILHLTFIAGALCITAYNRRAQIYLIIVDKIKKIHENIQNMAIKLSKKNFKSDLRETAKRAWIAIIKISVVSWQIAIVLYHSLKNILASLKGKSKMDEDELKIRLLSKIKVLGDERNELGQLLIAAIQENKNIRLQYKLESLSKSRLARHLEEIQKQSKSIRSRYITFQQLYLVTHEENCYLKARAKKLCAERDEAEKHLMILMEEANKSRDLKLRSLCDRLIQLRDEAIRDNSDTRLQQSRSSPTTSCRSPASRVFDTYDTNRFNALEAELVPWNEDEDVPKLRGLPGEYAWATRKNTDSVIEKLYEYDYGYTFDNGDTIRSIREYTVYHDKDCLLDFTKSGTVLQEVPAVTSSQDTHDETALVCQPAQMSPQIRIVEKSSVTVVTTPSRINVGASNARNEYTYNNKKRETPSPVKVVPNHPACFAEPIRCQCRPQDVPTSSAPRRFLTGSAAFKTFLQNNKNIIGSPSRPSPRPCLQC